MATTNANESGTRSYMKRDMSNKNNVKAGAANNPSGNYNFKDNNRDPKGYKASDKSKGLQTREKEQEPDNLEMLRRLEREKKVMQKKKNRDELYDDIQKPKRPQMKAKRMPKKDWTKSYIYGQLDEDDDYFW